jgi:putative DNA primase/helicase
MSGHEQPSGRAGSRIRSLDFAREHADELRYVAEWKRWYCWDGTRWKEDRTQRVFELARRMLRTHRDAAAKVSLKMITAVVTIARGDAQVAALPEQWDVDPWLLGTPAGTVDLRTGQLRSASPGDYITKLTAVSPDRNCASKRWRQFLHQITDGDLALQRYLQRMAGYFLTGVTKEDAFFFGYGTGRNGKRMLMGTIAGILGGYARTAPIDTFLASRSDRHPTDLAGLRGARLVTAAETPQGRSWDETKIKLVTGGDDVSARFMRGDFFDYKPQYKLFISGNNKPKIKTVDAAMRTRMNLIPFLVYFSPEERDPNLFEQLRREWPGILVWMIEGCLMWQREGLAPPPAVVSATEEYLTAEDVTAQWLDERCETGADMRESSKALWLSRRSWAESNKVPVGSHNQLGEWLHRQGFGDCKLDGQRGFRGLRLRLRPRSPRLVT